MEYYKKEYPLASIWLEKHESEKDTHWISIIKMNKPTECDKPVVIEVWPSEELAFAYYKGAETLLKSF
jgi:hypothetical protein